MEFNAGVNKLIRGIFELDKISLNIVNYLDIYPYFRF